MTDLPYLASRLYGTPLLIARPKLEVILGVVARKLAGDTLATPPPANVDAGMTGGLQIVDGITILPILGTLVRRSSYIGAASGLTSYHDIEAMAEAAFADPEVRAVLLEIDSGGGEAGGVFDLAQRLRTLAQTSGKPLWAIADEAALSAAYAIACAADRVWLTRTAEVGSIGVVAVHVDESVADAKAGLNYTFLHAGAHKVDGHPHAPLPASVAADIQADIEQLYDQFIALVAGFRRLTPEAIRDTEARVYRGEAALRVGLADRIGTRADAITALHRQFAMRDGRRSRNESAARASHPSQLPQKETYMIDHNTTDAPVEDVHEDGAPNSSPTPPTLDEAAIAAQVEQRLRRQLAELTEIAAQAKRLGVTVDPAQALARGVTPDALRQSVLKQAAERDVAQDIVAEASQQPHTKPQSVADSPLVKAAQAYGGRK
jgi:signal peptide peptidase SppA